MGWPSSRTSEPTRTPSRRSRRDSSTRLRHWPATLVPPPVPRPAARRTRLGVIFFGSTSCAMHEALDTLAAQGIHVNALRLRAFPFAASVSEFIAAHETVFVVEQNRDAQLRSMLVNELEINPAKLKRVLHYDGTPITARFITQAITDHVHDAVVSPEAP